MGIFDELVSRSSSRSSGVGSPVHRLTGSSSGGATSIDRDWRFLRESVRPSYEAWKDPVRVVDLFCGCGGLTLGVAEGARRLGRGLEVPLAVDIDDEAARVFKANFPHAEVQLGDVEFFFDGKVGSPLTDKEQAVRNEVGSVDFIVGGPPCQGHSDLNNRTRRTDHRNRLYLLMARAVEVLRPHVLVVENVQAVTKDKGRVVDLTESALKRTGYRVQTGLLGLANLGVPQRRRRHLLLATLQPLPRPQDYFQTLRSMSRPIRTLHWAIGDLVNRRNGDVLHVPSSASPANQVRASWLYENDAYDLPDHIRPPCHRDKRHSYGSVYGRLRWNQPAQTITTGFTSMGQGRFLHPTARRTITPREAARIQGFPDFFDFATVSRRTAWSEMIGNAVPPNLCIAIGKAIIPHLPPG